MMNMQRESEPSSVYLDMRETVRIQRWSSFISFSTMDREKGLRCWYSVLFTLILMYGLTSSEEQSKSCAPSRCGIITNISYPFRLRDDPPDRGDPIYELACENNVTLLHLYSGTYRVLGINYNNHTIRLVDPGIQKGNCSSLPRYLLSQSNFTDTYNFFSYGDRYDSRNPYNAALTYSQITFKHVVYLKCRDAVKDDAAYLDTAPCVNWEGGGHLYAVAGNLTAGQLKSQCRVKSVAAIASDWESRVGRGIKSYAEIHSVISFGFELSWWRRACVDFKCPSDQTCILGDETLSLGCEDFRDLCSSPMGITERRNCSDFSKLRILEEDYLYGMEQGLFQLARKGMYDHYNGTDFILTNAAIKLGIITGKVLPYIIVIIVRFPIGIILLSILLIYTYCRRHMSIFENIENFIRLHNLIPIRYTYKDLKTITKGFSDKLGEGGFGTVYKGKLRSGYDVAIKMLGKSTANGQEFISEVATIGRIHHVNVVNLVGFCVEGAKQALVYEFMSKGSLDKYIFSKQESISLSYHKIYEISVGVARGIDYFHHGCDMQILHFDIKPHNILLDDNFTPKISDFGLARLYHVDDSSITLTAARGTIGYIAPELFYKNIGRVSYKADVYSYGMLLMEMASRRRNLNPYCEHSSQLYFPLWIYDQLDEEKDIEMEDLTEEEKNLAKKMFIVALCCIQLQPDDRPSMSKVIEMLEADDVSSLEIPPKPSLYPNEQVFVNDGSSSSQAISTKFVHYSLSSSGEGTSCGT